MLPSFMIEHKVRLNHRLNAASKLHQCKIVNWWPNVELFHNTRRNGSLYIFGYDMTAMPTFDATFESQLLQELQDGVTDDIRRDDTIPPNNE